MVEKRVKKFGQGPPPFRAMPERKHFFSRRASLTNIDNIFSCLFHIKHFHVSLMYLRFKIGFELSSVTEY